MKWMKGILLAAAAVLVTVFSLKLPEIFCNYQVQRLSREVQVLEMDAVELSMKEPDDSALIGEDFTVTPLNSAGGKDTEQAETVSKIAEEMLWILRDSMGWDLGKKWDLQVQPFVASSSSTVEIFWRIEAELLEADMEIILWLDESMILRGLDLHPNEQTDAQKQPLPTVEPTPSADYSRIDGETEFVMALTEALYAIHWDRMDLIDFVEVTRIDFDANGVCRFTIYTAHCAYEGELTRTTLKLNPMGADLSSAAVDVETNQYMIVPAVDGEKKK